MVSWCINYRSVVSWFISYRSVIGWFIKYRNVVSLFINYHSLVGWLFNYCSVVGCFIKCRSVVSWYINYRSMVGWFINYRSVVGWLVNYRSASHLIQKHYDWTFNGYTCTVHNKPSRIFPHLLAAVLQKARNAEIWNSSKLRYLQTIFSYFANNFLYICKPIYETIFRETIKWFFFEKEILLLILNCTENFF